MLCFYTRVKMSWIKGTTILLSVLVLIVHNGLALTSSKMEDGDFLKIVSVLSGKVLTVSGSDANEGHPVVLSSWGGHPNQKFLAVEALVAGDSFLLMPQRQRYPWARFIRNGGTDPYRNRHDDLPDWTMVLEANTNTGQVTQDARDGKLYQQWRAVKVESPGQKKYLLKNRQNNQCLQGPGEKSPASSKTSTLTTTTAAPPTTTTTRRGFFGRMWSSISSAFGGGSDTSSTRTARSGSTGSDTSTRSASGNNVILAPCDSADVRQHWTLETLSLEYH